MNLKIKSIALVFLSSLIPQSYASTPCPFQYPFYIGASAGYGSTTWRGLVPAKEHENGAMSLSTPKDVTEGGLAGGVVAGVEFTPFFALEASYTRYPNAKIIFDEMSLVTYEYNITDLNTRTEVYALMAKIMLIIPNTSIRAFSSLGVGDLHRTDSIKDSWKLCPTFGFGFNYNLTPRFMIELGANYTSGYGETEINPTKDFMPFLYGAFLRIAYRFKA